MQTQALLSNLHRIGQLVRLSSLFDERDIPFVVIKGMSLVLRSYGIKSPRDMCDIDILIRVEDFESVSEALRGAGYDALLETRRQVMVNQGQECVFRSPGGTDIDLHYRLFSWYEEAYVYKIDRREFFERSVIEEWDSFKVRLLKKEDEFYYLLLCIFSENFQARRYFVDANALVCAHGKDWDWQALEKELVKSPLRETFASMLQFLRDEYKTPIPEDLLRPGRTRHNIRQRLAARPVTPFGHRVSLFRAAESAGDRRRLLMVYLRWQLFKMCGFSRDYFLSKNNPGGKPFGAPK